MTENDLQQLLNSENAVKMMLQLLLFSNSWILGNVCQHDENLKLEHMKRAVKWANYSRNPSTSWRTMHYLKRL